MPTSTRSAPREDQGGALAGFTHGARNYFVECFGRPYYVALFLMTTCAGMAFLPINTFSIPYAASLGIDMKVYGQFLALTFVISLMLSFFLGWLADLFHPLRMAMIFLGVYAVVSVFAALTAVTSGTFLFAWVLHVVISGCYFTSAATLGQRLFPQSRFAQYASAGGIVGSLGVIVQAPIVGALIDVTSGAYRVTFLVGAICAVVALGIGFFVHREFERLGGQSHYKAPE